MSPSSKESEIFDVVIVGGGLSGCVTAAAIQAAFAARGQAVSILILEARAAKNPRFNGELIHPTGVEVLEKHGFLPHLEARESIAVVGFACLPDKSRPATILPYSDVPNARPSGLAMDHHEMVEILRQEVVRRPGIELRSGERVTEIVRSEEQVTGVRTPQKTYLSKLVVACDGRHSKIRTLLGLEESATLLSYTAALHLLDCELPHPGYGHIVLGAWGPILAYPIRAHAAPEITATEARACIDLPLEMERGTEAMIRKIREEYVPHLPATLADAFTRALDAQAIELAANYSIRTRECAVPGAVLIGDACGCSHPITAGGMTVALKDAQLLAETLAARTDLTDRARTFAALEEHEKNRYRYVRAREILADAIYEVFRGADDGTRAIRAGIFRYWNGSQKSRARSIALLSGHESRLPKFLLEYLTVVGQSTSTVLRGKVNDPTWTGRLRSLVGLSRKSLEKLGQVAESVRDGSISM